MNSSRNLTLDLLRGFFLVVIIIDHVGRFPNLLEFLTGAGRLWVSAAEGFFIISGILVGLLYASKILSTPLLVTKKLWTRAFKLYLLSVLLTIFFTYLGRRLPLDEIKFGIDLNSGFWDLLYRTLTFKYVYGWGDFLPFYCVFLLFSPLALIVAKKLHWIALILLSFAIWMVRGNNEFMAWQFVFLEGVVIGMNLRRLEAFYDSQRVKMRHLIKNILGVSTAITILTSVIFVVFVWPNSVPFFFDKDKQGLGRLILSPLWFGTAYVFLRDQLDHVNHHVKKSLLTFGQNSLSTYVLHAVVLFPLNIVFPYSTFIPNTFLTIFILALVFGVLIISLGVNFKNIAKINHD